MTIAKDVIGSVAPLAAVGVLAYLAAKKFGFIGSSSKDSETGDYDPLHLQDTMRVVIDHTGNVWDWMQPKGVFDPQTAQTVTFNPLNAPGASSLNQAIAGLGLRDLTPIAGRVGDTVWLRTFDGRTRSASIAGSSAGSSGGASASSVASAATGKTSGGSRSGTYPKQSMAPSLSDALFGKATKYYGGKQGWR